jgi:hypothetical protein
MSTGIAIKKIETVKDLMNATVPKGATFINGGYDLFYKELKKYIIVKGNKLMLWEDWYNKPHPLISKTEDADFEVVKPLMIDAVKDEPSVATMNHEDKMSGQ